MTNATDPSTLPADVRHKLLLIRTALVYGDEGEAGHWLYAIACPSFTCLDPWAALEGRACQCGPHRMEQTNAAPSLESFEASYAGRPYSAVETVAAQHDETGRMWEGPRDQIPPGYSAVDGITVTDLRGVDSKPPY